MVYRRRLKKGGRVTWTGKTWYFDGLLRDGRRKQLSTETTAKPLAQRIAAMWESLAIEHRAWELLGLVLDGSLPMGRLFDLWVETRYTPLAMLARVREVDLEPLVEEWHRHHRGNVKGDSADHALRHVRALIPEGVPCPAPSITVKRLTQFIAGYQAKPRSKAEDAEPTPVKRNTRRKVHSSLAGFFAYATRVHGAYLVDPMTQVERPAAETSPIRFHELDVVERIVGRQPTLERRALLAFQYGSAVEVSVSLGLRRRDFLPERKEVRAAGTKAVTRDRVCRVADWAWPTVWEYVRGFHPDARPWGHLNRHSVSDWHREAQQALEVPVYPLHNARDHWAVRALRDGRAAIGEVQAQLGHGTAMQTLEKYGRWIPRGEHRDAIEARARSSEEQRRRAES